MNPGRNKLLIAGAVLAALVIALFAAYRLALGELRARVITALGPDSEIGEIDLSFRAIRISGLKLKAPAGWPARYALSAEQVVIVPDLSSLTGRSINIASISVDRAYLAVLRDRNGKLRVVPGLTERTKDMAAGKSAATPSAPIPVRIGEISLKNSSIAFFDAAVRSPPLAVTLSQVEARITALRIPALDEASTMQLSARVEGPSGNGSVDIDGTIAFASRNSEIRTRIRNVDVVTLEPYLIRKAETGVRRGTLDLDLTSRVVAQRIHAPGILKLNNLELRSEGGIGTFMGMPRDSVVGMLRERDGSISIPFTIEGSLNDPNFALDGAFKARVALAAAATLGISLRDLADALKNRDKTGDQAGKVIDALKGLLGR